MDKASQNNFDLLDDGLTLPDDQNFYFENSFNMSATKQAIQPGELLNNSQVFNFNRTTVTHQKKTNFFEGI